MGSCIHKGNFCPFANVHPRPHGDLDADAHLPSIPHPDTDSNANPNADTDAHLNPHTDIHPNPVSNGDPPPAHGDPRPAARTGQRRPLD